MLLIRASQASSALKLSIRRGERARARRVRVFLFGGGGRGRVRLPGIGGDARRLNGENSDAARLLVGSSHPILEEREKGRKEGVSWGGGGGGGGGRKSKKRRRRGYKREEKGEGWIKALLKAETYSKKLEMGNQSWVWPKCQYFRVL